MHCGPPIPGAESGSTRDVFPWTAACRRTFLLRPRRNSSCSPRKTRRRGTAAGPTRRHFNGLTALDDQRRMPGTSQHQGGENPCRSRAPRACRCRIGTPLGVRSSQGVVFDSSATRLCPRKCASQARFVAQLHVDLNPRHTGRPFWRPSSDRRTICRPTISSCAQTERVGGCAGAAPRCRYPPQRGATALSNGWSSRHLPGMRNQQSLRAAQQIRESGRSLIRHSVQPWRYCRRT